MELKQRVIAAQNEITDVLLNEEHTLRSASMIKRRNRKLSLLRHKKQIGVGFASYGLDAPLTVSIAGSRNFTGHNVNKTMLDERDLHERFDVIIVNHNYLYDDKTMKNVKSFAAQDEKPVIVIIWYFDHHHMYDFCLTHSGDFDYHIRCHYFGTDYLSAYFKNFLGTLPCPVMQWNLSQIPTLAATFLDNDRSNALYGGFRAYGHPREKFARLCQANVTPNHIYVQTQQESETSGFFAMSAEERFADWCNYKTSLVLPVRNDMPSRIFDAILTGQIPIVSDEIIGLDTVIPVGDQLELPVLRFRGGDLEHVKHVHRVAIEIFDKMGADGVRKRYEYAKRRHTVESSLRTITGLLESELRVAEPA